jgi:hypothetical protein
MIYRKAACTTLTYVPPISLSPLDSLAVPLHVLPRFLRLCQPCASCLHRSRPFLVRFLHPPITPCVQVAVASHDDLLRVHPQPKSCDMYFAWLFDPGLSSWLCFPLPPSVGTFCPRISLPTISYNSIHFFVPADL